MEAVRQVDTVTNTRDRLLNNRSSSKRKSSYHSIQKDTADLSPVAIALSREGMDINKSSVVEEEQNFKYDLHFKDRLTKKLRSEGELDKKNKEASPEFEFKLKKEQVVNGIPHNKSLKFFMSYKLSEFEYEINDQKKNKNISLYVRELVGDIEEILGKKMDTKGVAVNDNDLKKIQSSEQQKISDKLIQLIKITLSLANMRKNLEENESEKIDKPKEQQKAANNKIAKLKDFKLEVTEAKTKTMKET